ncbi:nitric oxide-sensing protein NosP [Sessilibacter corallicola]|uniref:FIST signal transduction protein n=1 Tax=Sessilibacter corallicola TaxID=2904075 RepID=A0ABQ0A736_9GAMM|nr:nitric oxide-sensing protein NosP [Sessilibacter corallicola]MCE2028437.1 FIST C-terminal domain-containing protein [Sessilibacter corallicola]
MERLYTDEPDKISHSLLTSPTVLKASSSCWNASEAVKEIFESLGRIENACVFFFCCADYDLNLLAAEINRFFTGCNVVGCTTAGEITPHGLAKRSITAFLLPPDHFVIESNCVTNLAEFTEEDAKLLVDDIMGKLEAKAVAPIKTHSFGLTLQDGMSIREELVLKAYRTALNNIPLVGGSAGDNLHFHHTQVFYDGRFHSDAAILLLINTKHPFRVFQSHHLVSTGEKLVVTRAAPSARRVYELNAEPAALEYCRIHNLDLKDLNSETFALNPLGVQLSDSIYVRSIQQVHEDLSLTFFCAIDVGIVLTQLNSSGVLDHTKSLFSEITSEIGVPELLFACDCIYRRIEIEKFDLCKKISDLYARHNVIGFNTYGEQLDGMHLNHTFTGVAIGRHLDD